jgi:hypothetical protein
VVSVTPQPLSTPGIDQVPIVQEAGWAPEPAWTSAENLASIGVRSPDLPPRSQSLYRLSYRAHITFINSVIYKKETPNIHYRTQLLSAVHGTLCG